METPSTLHLNFDEVYEPAEDSFLLMDAVEQDLAWLKLRKPSLCVEVGSGSGIIASAVSKTLGVACLTSDINPKACSATKKTSVIHKVSGKLDAVCTDLLTSFIPRLYGKVDILLFNPPYVPTETSEICGSGISRSWAGGMLGREVTDRLLPVVPQLLSAGGVFYILLLQENKPSEIEEMFAKQGLVSTQVMARRAGRESLLVLRICRPN